MPTYGYECLGCARSFETYQKITDDTLTQCDSCGGVLRKKVFPVGIVFKGSGFYVNDYSKKGGNGEEAAVQKSDPVTSEVAATPETDSAAAPTNAPEVKPAEAAPAAPVPAASTPAATPSPKPA